MLPMVEFVGDWVVKDKMAIRKYFNVFLSCLVVWTKIKVIVQLVIRK